jgi:tellurite methyltransferase
LKDDRDKWNARYNGHDGSTPAPDPLLVEYRSLLTSGRALDLASGLGANAIFLAESGYRVDAIDISEHALARLKAEADRRLLNIDAVIADLDDYPLPKNLYDLVAVFHFFLPRIMPAIQDSLKQGGLLFYATYNFRHTSVKPEFSKKYLVPPGGLIDYFPDLDVVLHESEAGDAGNISRLIARRQ